MPNALTTQPEYRSGIRLGVSRDNDVLTRVRTLARLLDAAFTIPGTRVRIGVDAILGLLPVLGDLISAVLSASIVRAGAQLGVPRAVLAHMTLNIAIDAALGSLPILGDVCDVFWRANLRNVALIERALANPRATSRHSVLILLVAAVGFLLIVAALWLLLQSLLGLAG